MPSSESVQDTAVAGVTIGSDPGTPSGPTPSAAVARGTVISRYVVLDRVGSGGMGVVYSAWDPELDRKVAIKLLRHGDRTRSEGKGARRLLREAQAMAKLTHPNVATVFDVGEHDSGVFVAMEFIDGPTLRRWLVQRKRSWREVIDVFLAAGRGLSAAHRAGLVHRDFKPENVMIGRDGRVRVMDFGLARPASPLGPEFDTLSDLNADGPHSTRTTKRRRDGPARDAEIASTPPRLARSHGADGAHAGPGPGGPREDVAGSARVSADPTHTGALLGTPAYMAPEQHLAQPTDARTDQFSFCVALWESLYGQRPFAGTNLAALSLAVTTGELRPAPPRTRVPTWLRRALARGLASKPSARWPDMDSLLSAIDRRESPRRNRRLAFAGVLALGGLLGATLGLATLFDRDAEPCAASGAVVRAIWDDGARAEVRRGLRSSGMGWSSQTADQVALALDDWSLRWASAAQQACHATRQATPTAIRLQRAPACLDAELSALRGMVALMSAPDRGVIERALEIAATLPAPEDCLDPDHLDVVARLPDDAPTARGVVEVERRIQEAQLWFDAGRYQSADDRARALAEEARVLGHAPTHARAALLAARTARERGDADAAEVLARAAFAAARRADDRRAGVRAATALFSILARERGRPEVAWEWHAVALADIEGLPEGARERLRLRAELLSSASAVSETQGRYPEALEYGLAALADHARMQPPDELAWADAHANVAAVQTSLLMHEQARASLGRVIEVRTRKLGANHPHTARARFALGAVAVGEGAFAEAEVIYREVLTSWREAYGDAGVDVAGAWANLGVALEQQGKIAEAVEAQQTALATIEAADGISSGRGVNVLTNLGNLYVATGRFEEALALQERAVAALERVWGPEHPDLAAVLNNRGLAHKRLGQDAAALADFARALSILAPVPPEQSVVRGDIYTNIADVHRGRGALAEAIAAADSGLEAYAASYGPDHPALFELTLVRADLATQARDLVGAEAWLSRAAALGGAEDNARVIAALVAVSRVRLELARTGDRAAARAALARARAEFDALGDAIADEERTALEAFAGELGPRGR